MAIIVGKLGLLQQVAEVTAAFVVRSLHLETGRFPR